MMSQLADPYSRNAHTSHWLSYPPNNHHKKKRKPIVDKPKPKITNTFNTDVIDTFCFHWPDMQSYVLVRVLEETIAILPVRSRVAFLYFHHAPMPTHPSPRELRKALQQHQNPSRRIHYMFKSWKHTLALVADEEEEEAEEDENDTPTNSTTPASVNTPVLETPPSTPKEKTDVSLSDVLSYEPTIKTGWIHAHCTVKDDGSMFGNHVVLTTQHNTVLKLTARCYAEKMMFMNLVKLKHKHLRRLPQNDEPEDDDDKTQIEELDLDSKERHMIQKMKETIQLQLESISDLTIQLKISKESISYYIEQLFELERSLDSLSENTQQHNQLGSLKKELDFVNHQLTQSTTDFNMHRERVFLLQERVSSHNAFLMGARQRFELIRKKFRSHAWYPWFYTSLTGTVLVFAILVSYSFYTKDTTK